MLPLVIENMTVSVIIPTYNGAKKINGLFESLKAQLFKDFELIVVNDGSTDNTLEIIQQNESSFNNMRVITRPNGGRAKVRNTGAKEAKGELLIFLDDDMRPRPHCLEVHVKHHEKFPSSILTGAQIDESNENATDIEKFKSSLSKRWTKDLINASGNQLPKKSIFITAANFSIPKELFDRLEGFDERLKDAEDFDLAIKAYKHNIPLYFNYEAYAAHEDPVSFKQYVKRQRQYNIAHNTLIQLKPWISEEGYLHQTKKPTGFKKFLFKIFTFNFWIKGADKNWFTIIPKNFRYRLYDIIVTANGVYFPEKISLE